MRRALILALPLLLAACTAKPLVPPLRIYAAVDQEVAEQVFAAFTADTGIEVEAVYDSEAAKTAGLAKRVEMEKDSPGADIWWSGESLYTAMLDARGCFVALPEGLPEAARKFGGSRFAAHAGRLRVLVYSEKTWPKDLPPPTSVAALADARLKGRCAAANPQFGTSATHFSALNASGKGKELLRRIADNGLQVVASNSAVVRAVAQGDALLGLTDSDDAIILRKDSPHIRMVIPDQGTGQDGTVLTPASVAIIRKQRDSEEFVRWLVSKKGEAAMARSQMRNLPLVSDAKPPAELPPLRELTVQHLDYSVLAARFEEHRAYLKATFRQ
jgi:iron(III) transport system substrate-binding protein